MYPPARQNSRRGSAILILVITAAVASTALAVGITKFMQSTFVATDSVAVTMQAQQYADARAMLVKKTDYRDLAATAKSTIAGTDFQEEVAVSAESDYADHVKQRLVTVKVYKGAESQPRAELTIPMYSVRERTGVPIGTIIAWSSTKNPAEGEWLDCNGQSCAEYPELVAALGKSVVPDYRGRFLEGAEVPGAVKEAGLPNITGSFGVDSTSLGVLSGAFYHIGQANGAKGGSPNNSSAGFDASRSNLIYGRSDTVQPPAVTVRYLIKATW